MKYHLPVLAIALAALSGCNSSSSGSSTTYNALAVWQNLIENGYTFSGTCPTATTTTTTGATVSTNVIELTQGGVVTSYPVTCSIVRTVASGLGNVAFEGQTALMNSGTTTGSETANGTTYTLVNNAFQTYSDQTTFNPLGRAVAAPDGINPESFYEVLAPNTTATLPPNSVGAGSNGVIATFNRYADNTKATQIGTTKLSYSVLADTTSTTTPATLILEFIRDEFDMDKNKISTETISWRIDSSATGNPVFVSDSLSQRVQTGPWAGWLLRLYVTP